LLDQNRLERHHYFCRLNRVRSRTDLEMKIGRRNIQINKKRIGHRRVIMLSGVNDKRLKFIYAPPHLANNRRDFHKIRTRPDNV
jgi:hypothetical protein